MCVNAPFDMLANSVTLVSPSRTHARTYEFTCEFISKCYIRCGYTGHFYRGKLPFYHGKLYLAV